MCSSDLGDLTNPLDCPNYAANNLRIAIISFGGTVSTDKLFSDAMGDVVALYTQVASLHQDGGATALGTALRKARRQVLITEAGFRGTTTSDSNYEALMVIVTDGCASDGNRFRSEIERFNTDDDLNFMTRLAFGIGNYVCDDELMAMASTPNDVYQIASFDALGAEHSDVLSSRYCTPLPSIGEPGDKGRAGRPGAPGVRSEEHTSELQSP